MNLAEKFRFLADRAEDGQQFYIMYSENKILTDYEECTESYDIWELEGMELFNPQWEFTEDEKVILRNLPKQHKWIARDESGSLYLYDAMPHKQKDHWTISLDIFGIFSCFNHLFQSVQWSDEEPCEFRRYI